MASLQQLAINGGPKTKTTPYGTGQRFAGNELRYLQQALESNTLFYGYGTFVKRACEMMKDYTGRRYAFACTSGSAAIHLGLVAAGIGPGDEVILTPNTDAGTELGIIAEGAVPVFCDCDWTLQPTAASVAAKITARTRAVVVVHIAGAPAPVDEIVAFCQAKGIAVVEDCAQSWGTKLKGRRVGTTGVAGCYSVNDFKHLSCGDGGFVLVDDETLYRRVANYGDKWYDRFYKGEQSKAHHGVNYRMSELQGAVACAQLEQADAITSVYHARGDQLYARLEGLQGGRLMDRLPGAYCTYWWTTLFVDAAALTVGRDQIAAALQAEGVPFGSYGKYDLIQAGLFQKRVVRPWLDDERRHYPLVQPDGRSYTYSLDQTPTHRQILECGLQFSFGRFHSEQDIEETAAAVQKVFAAYAR